MIAAALAAAINSTSPNASKVSPFKRLKQRREAGAMGDEARTRNGAFDRSPDPVRVRARFDVDIDDRRQWQVRLGAGGAEPAFERSAQFLGRNLLWRA